MKRIICIIASVFMVLPAFCCTSVIISGKATASGRPVMMKHRDTGELNNRIERFKGPVYDFIALVNSPVAGGEAWTGVNSAGFSIMNTATYDLKDDDVPSSEMDKEGVVMYKALGVCATIEDFEKMLDTLPRPMGVEANFGVIDARGGAAYYEVNNHSWTKFDVNDPTVAPKGYRVVTNFTQTGRPKDRKGVDRYELTCEDMAKIYASSDRPDVNHETLFNVISRKGKPVLRDITSASIVIEGVKAGENPLHTVMWTLLGYPTSTVYMPLLVMDNDCVPAFMKKSDVSDNSIMCSLALAFKGGDYMDSFRKIEASIDEVFEGIFGKWISGKMTTEKFLAKYDALCNRYFEEYYDNFREYWR